jgi:hypothetical protein
MNAEEAQTFVDESRKSLTELWETSPWIKQ